MGAFPLLTTLLGPLCAEHAGSDIDLMVVGNLQDVTEPPYFSVSRASMETVVANSNTIVIQINVKNVTPFQQVCDQPPRLLDQLKLCIRETRIYSLEFANLLCCPSVIEKGMSEDLLAAARL